MKNFFVETLQKALNRYLMLDPESKTRLNALQNTSVTIELLGLNLIFQLLFKDDHIDIQYDDIQQSDTIISGTPLTLVRMVLTQGDRKHFFSDDVSIQGNLDLGQEVIDLFDHLEIDWEEYLSHWIGDLPAHRLGVLGRHVKTLGQRINHILSQDINEYVHEEVDWFPSLEALQDFYSDVDILRMDVDRTESRMAILKKLIKGN